MRSSAHDLCTFCKCSDSTSMLIFGLTGGIATGKSTVSDILLELGCPVIDADVLARRVVEPGKPAWKEIVKHFGEAVLLDDGCLDRERLGSLIFSNEQKRQILNRCTHPFIRRAVIWEIVKNFIKGKPYVVLVSPLLFETKYAIKYMRQIVVVSCTPTQQVTRLMARDKLSEEQALERIQSQIPLSSKCLWADVEIDNSHDRLTTRWQVERLVVNMNRLSYCRRFGLISIIVTLFLFFLFIYILLV